MVMLPMMLLLILLLSTIMTLLILVLQLRAHKGTGKGTDDSMSGLSSDIVTAQPACYCAHYAAISLTLDRRIGGAVLLLLVLLLSVGVIGIRGRGVLVVGTLLGELMRWIALVLAALMEVSLSWIVLKL